MASRYHIVGCQNINKKYANSNGGHWNREEEARRVVQQAV